MGDRHLHDSVRYELNGPVARIILDDGKANALSGSVVAALDGALDQAEADGAGAVLLTGRDGRFSAGFHLPTMTESTEAMRGLVGAGARLIMRLYGFPRPVVAACTGHALAAGAMLLLASDVRVGADGPFKLGLNEVAIGMPLPIFATELARDRVATRHFAQATALARIYSPTEAVEAGFLDRVCLPDDVAVDAFAEANRLAELPGHAVGRSKQTARRATIDRILTTLDDDLASVGVPTPAR